VTGNAGSNAQTFTYDPLRRLTGSSLNSAAVGYTYDLDGNRTRTVDGGVTSDFSYDRSDQLISQSIAGTPTAFAYDAYGNLTAAATPSATQTVYAYDLGDRLTSITPPGGSATTFSYDALGRIASRGADAYSYVGTTETVWRISSGASSTTSAVAADGSRVAVSAGSDFGWLLPDLHGNTAAALNQAETAISSALRYDGYGQTIASYASGSLPTPWKYQGRLDVSPDSANPLYEAGARYYSPAIGAFTQLDSYAGSAQNPLSLNRYLYAGANPTSFVDPDGHRFRQGNSQQQLRRCRRCGVIEPQTAIFADNPTVLLIPKST
jgi:RHS repeat-associated protein